MNDNEMKVELYEIEISKYFAPYHQNVYTVTYFLNNNIVVIKKSRESLTIAERNLINSKFLVSNHVFPGSYACRRYSVDVTFRFSIHFFNDGRLVKRIYDESGILISEQVSEPEQEHEAEQDTSEQDTSEQETSEQETSEQETSEQETSEQETSEQNNDFDSSSSYAEQIANIEIPFLCAILGENPF